MSVALRIYGERVCVNAFQVTRFATTTNLPFAVW